MVQISVAAVALKKTQCLFACLLVSLSFIAQFLGCMIILCSIFVHEYNTSLCYVSVQCRDIKQQRLVYSTILLYSIRSLQLTLHGLQQLQRKSVTWTSKLLGRKVNIEPVCLLCCATHSEKKPIHQNTNNIRIMTPNILLRQRGVNN